MAAPGIYVPQPMDVGSTHGIEPVRFFERFPGEPPSVAGHTFIISRPNTVMEALTTVVETPWPEFEPACEIYRCNLFTPAQLKETADFAVDKFLGDPYGVLKIPTQLVDWGLAKAAYYLWGRTGDLHLARRFQFLRYSFPNCHLLSSIPFEDVREYLFGVPAWQTNPDQINDWQRESCGWDLVYRSPDWEDGV